MDDLTLEEAAELETVPTAKDPFRFVEWAVLETDGEFYTDEKDAADESEKNGQVEVGYCEFGSREDGKELVTVSFARDGEFLFWKKDSDGDITRERFMNPDEIDYRENGFFVEKGDRTFSWGIEEM